MKLATPLRIKLNSGVELAYSDTKEADKPALIFIHGLSCYSMFWEGLIIQLKKKYRCIAIDLPGHGYTNVAPGWKVSIGACALLIFELQQALGLKKIYLCGHSLGGQIAVRFDADYPGQAEKLVLISPAGIETFSDSERQYIESLESFSRLAMPLFGNQLSMLMKGAAQALLQHTEQIQRKRQDLNHLYTAAMLREPVYHFYKLRPTPKLVIFGKQDELIPNPFLQRGSTEAYIKEACAAISSVKLRFVSAGHFPYLSSPLNVASAIEEFLG